MKQHILLLLVVVMLAPLDEAKAETADEAISKVRATLTCEGCLEIAEGTIEGDSGSKTFILINQKQEHECSWAGFTSSVADVEYPNATPKTGKSYLSCLNLKQAQPLQWAWFPSQEKSRSVSKYVYENMTGTLLPFIFLNIWSITDQQYTWEWGGTAVLRGIPKNEGGDLPNLLFQINSSYLISKLTIAVWDGAMIWELAFEYVAITAYHRPKKISIKTQEGRDEIFFPRWCMLAPDVPQARILQPSSLGRMPAMPGAEGACTKHEKLLQLVEKK